MIGHLRSHPRARWGLALALLALAGLAISLYLTALKLVGGVPPCIVGNGCDTVQTSAYSAVLGIPVAAFGAAWSAIAMGAALAWWRGGDRRMILLLYAGGLAGTLFEGYLVYLELFVMHAVCSWCVAYGVTVVAGWLLAVAAVLRTRVA